MRTLDCSCFNGDYVTALGKDYFSNLARERSSDRGDRTGRMSASNALDTLQITEPGRGRSRSPEMVKMRPPTSDAAPVS